MTNSVQVFNMFNGRNCSGHDHQVIEGAEGGVMRSRWAQCYPPELVEAMVEAIRLQIKGA